MWYRKDRGAYYTTIDGRRHNLGPDKARATKAFHTLMADDGKGAPPRRGRVTVAEAVEAMMAAVAHMRPKTRRLYYYNLGPFAAEFRGRKLDTIHPDEVKAFVARYPGRQNQNKGFGDASRYLMFRYAKQLFRWAKDIGILELNPMHGKTCDWRIMPRQRVMTRDEYDLFMASKASPQFKEVVAFLWATGARPGEAVAICARHLDAHHSVVRLQPTEHKTGTKTGAQREISVPDGIMARLRESAVERPRTPLLVDTKGRPWTQGRVSDMWGYWRPRIGLAPDCVLYLARHAYGTRMVDAGYSVAEAATALGHRDTQTFMTNYWHANKQRLLDACNALDATAASPDALARLRDKVEDVRRLNAPATSPDA